MNDSSVIGDLVAIVTAVTAAGGAIYALGLIGLAVSIRLRITDDVSTAWYAVSLLSRIVVVGQGARIWFFWPFILTIAMLLVAWAVAVFTTKVVHIGLVIIGVPFVLATFLSSRIQRAVAREEAQVPARLPALAAAGLLPFLGSYTIAIGAANLADPFFNFSQSVAVLFIFVGSFLVGVRPAMAAKLPLPVVTISMKPQNPSEPNTTPLRGILVTHGDSFWHLFNENNELVSIPDEQVLEVRIGGKADTLPAEGTANTEDSQ